MGLSIWKIRVGADSFPPPHVCMLRRVQLVATPRTVARQTSLTVGFSRQACWSGLPCLSLGELPDPGNGLASLGSPALESGFLLVPPGSPLFITGRLLNNPGGVTVNKTQAYLYRASKYTANYKSAFQYSGMEVTRERHTVQCCRHLRLSFGGATSPPRLNPCDLRHAAYTSSSV